MQGYNSIFISQKISDFKNVTVQPGYNLDSKIENWIIDNCYQYAHQYKMNQKQNKTRKKERELKTPRLL